MAEGGCAQIFTPFSHFLEDNYKLLSQNNRCFS